VIRTACHSVLAAGVAVGLFSGVIAHPPQIHAAAQSGGYIKTVSFEIQARDPVKVTPERGSCIYGDGKDEFWSTRFSVPARSSATRNVHVGIDNSGTCFFKASWATWRVTAERRPTPEGIDVTLSQPNAGGSFSLSCPARESNFHCGPWTNLTVRIQDVRR